MARKRQKDKNLSVIDLAQSIGLTMMKDTSGIDIKDWLPTEIPHLDRILGGGIPFGRVTEMYGLNSTGKSVFGVHLTRQAQKYGVTTIWIDVEGTSSSSNMRQLGADPDNIVHFQPQDSDEKITIERVSDKVKEIVEVFKDTEKPVLMIWDSIAATPSEAGLKNPTQIGTNASAITKMVEAIGQDINQTNIGFFILNQARDDMNANAFMGPQQTSTGGQALKHWSTLRLEVKKGKQVKEKVTNPVTLKPEDVYIGHIFRVITEKSKVSTPNQRAELFLISAPFKGIDKIENLYRLSVAAQDSSNQYGFITSGAWRSYTTDEGKEIKLRSAEWVDFLESEEGRPVAEELQLKQFVRNFPNWYTPLENENIVLEEVDPFYTKLREYYESLKEAPESKEEEEEED